MLNNHSPERFHPHLARLSKVLDARKSKGEAQKVVHSNGILKYQVNVAVNKG